MLANFVMGGSSAGSAKALAVQPRTQVSHRELARRAPTSGFVPRFAAVRGRCARHDYWRRAESRPEQWLFIEWPQAESEPTKYD